MISSQYGMQIVKIEAAVFDNAGHWVGADCTGVDGETRYYRIDQLRATEGIHEIIAAFEAAEVKDLAKDP